MYDVCARLQPYLRKNIGSQPNISRIFFPAIRNSKKFGLGVYFVQSEIKHEYSRYINIIHIFQATDALPAARPSVNALTVTF